MEERVDEQPGEPMARAWVVPVFAILAILLVPWILWLSLTLPPAQRAAQYRLAWVGFDGILLVSLASVAISALRDSALLERVATSAGVLLVVDAWFDLTTSNGTIQELQALVLAVAIELPLAAVCLWVAGHAVDVRRRCEQMLRRRLTNETPACAPRRDGRSP